jgi:diguanylate cyclase (GGDEF)-like protein
MPRGRITSRLQQAIAGSIDPETLRYSVETLAPACLVLVAITTGLAWHAANEALERIKVSQEAKLLTNHGLLQGTIASAQSDVRFVAGLHELRALADQAEQPELLRATRAKLRQFTADHWSYQALDWIDHRGQSAFKGAQPPLSQKVHESLAGSPVNVLRHNAAPQSTPPPGETPEADRGHLVVSHPLISLNGLRNGHLMLSIALSKVLNPPKSELMEVKPRCFLIVGSDGNTLYDSDLIHTSADPSHPPLHQSDKLTQAVWNQMRLNRSGQLNDRSGLWRWTHLKVTPQMQGLSSRDSSLLLTTHIPAKVIRTAQLTRILPLILGAAATLLLVLLPISYLMGLHRKKRRSVERMQGWQASHDALTGCLNRHGGLQTLNDLLTAQAGQQHLMGLLFVDLDRLSVVNNNFGHAAGDEAIRQVAMAIKGTIRTNDPVIRMGGDEFVVVLPQLHNEEECVRIAEKICKACDLSLIWEGTALSLSVSIGIANNRTFEDCNIQEMLARADQAMLHAKRTGRNKVIQLARETASALTTDSAATANSAQEAAQAAITADRAMPLGLALSQAISNRELSLRYQPLVNEQGQLVGAEALLRWQLSEGQQIRPDVFIPLAERLGEMPRIGQWVIEQACQQLQHWDERGYPPLQLSINLSATQFQPTADVPDVVDILDAATKACDLAPNQLELEITETTVLLNQAKVKEQLETLRARGYGVVIDDFGAGFASLDRLRKFPASRLKLDKNFTEKVESNTKDAVLVEAVQTIAEKLGMGMVAEGVETLNQFRQLRLLGCQLFQGYLFSKPLTAECFERECLKNHRLHSSGLFAAITSLG